MAQVLKKEYSLADFEMKYIDITTLYDYAEELINTVESELASDPNKQLAIVEPLINEIGNATDLLSEEFILIAEYKQKKGQNKASKNHIESALRRLFVAIGDYQGRVRDVSKLAHGSIMNIADPIVKKIQTQIEQIVVIFLELAQISLQSVMNKAELDSLRARNAQIALMMHQHALSHQG